MIVDTSTTIFLGFLALYGAIAVSRPAQFKRFSMVLLPLMLLVLVSLEGVREQVYGFIPDMMQRMTFAPAPQNAEGFENSASTRDESMFAMYGVSWCPQCQEQLPTFRELRRRQDGKDFGGRSLRMVYQDCEGTGKGACDSAGIKKYPAQKLHHAGTVVDYKSPIDPARFNEFLLNHIKAK